MAYTTGAGAIIRMGVEGAEESRRQVDSVGASFSRLGETVHRSLTTLAGAVGIGTGLAEVIQLSDQYAKLTSQLRLAATSQSEYARSYDDVKRIATTAQADMNGVAMLYARIANGTRELGIAQKRVADIAEVVNLALKVSGATAEEAASAQLQLSQAFASGTLRGEEFNAVNEAAPRLMQALADGMGVPVGALKKMASEGQITSKVMADVLPQALERLREEAAGVQTIGGAFTVLKNKLLEYTAVSANANGTVSTLTTGIGFLSDHLGELFGVIQTLTAARLGTWAAEAAKRAYDNVSANRALAASTLAAAEANAAATASALTLANARAAELRMAVLAAEGETALAITANGLIPAQARAAAAAEAHAVALTTLSRAQAATSVSAGLARGALGLLGGPIGAVITVLGLAATAWATWGSSAEEGSAQAKGAVAESTDDIVAGIDKQIQKLQERNELARRGIPVGKDQSPAAVRLGEVVAKIDQAGKGTGEYAGLDLAARTEILKALGREYGLLTERIAAFNRESEQDAANKAKKGYGEWMVKYSTNAEKLAAELDKARKELGAAFTPELEARIRKQFEEKEKGANKEESAYASLLVRVREKIAETDREAAGLKPLNEAQKLEVALTEALAAGKLKLSVHHKALYQEQIKHLANNIAVIESQKRAAEGLEGWNKMVKEHEAEVARTIASAEKEADRNEELARTYGMTKAAIEAQELARLEEQLAQRGTLGLTIDEIETLEKLIDAKRRSAAAVQSVETRDAAKKLLDQQEADVKRAADSMSDSLTDALMRGFEKGTDIAKNFRDTLVNMLKTVVVRPTIQAVISPISAGVSSMFGPSVAQAATGGSGGGAAGSMLGSVAGGLFGAGGLAGALTAGAGWVTGATTFGGALSAGASLIGTGTMAGAASGLGMIAGALGPIALGVAAVLAVVKHFDTSGTKHTGGASSATAAGTSSVSAESLGMANIALSEGASKLTSGLASSIVSILDSTATTFGKAAGYSAATAFADDTSKDGAWGALVIKKMDQTLVDWNANRTSRWAPREYADGEAGQKQYLAELSGSVRAALDSIGLPSWATAMLDKLGAGASVEELAKAVDEINATEAAINKVRGAVAALSGASDESVLALVKAAGGVDNLMSGLNGFYSTFYSESEKIDAASKQIEGALQSVGLAMPATRAEFRAMVEQQLKLGESGASAATVLLSVASAFAELHPQAEQAAQAVTKMKDVAGERQSLLDQLAELTLTEEQLRERERNAIDETNRDIYDQVQAQKALKESISKATEAANEQRKLDIQLLTAQGRAEEALRETRKDVLAGMLSDQARATQMQIWAISDAREESDKWQTKLDTAAAAVSQARSNVTSAYQREAGALNSVIEAKLADAAATRKQLAALKLGDLSSMSPTAKYDEARRQWMTATGAAKNEAGMAFLELSRSYNGSSEAYAADERAVLQAMEATAASSEAEASAAQAQLDALDSQLAAIGLLNANVKDGAASTTEAIAELQTSLAEEARTKERAEAAKAAAAKLLEDQKVGLMTRQANGIDAVSTNVTTGTATLASSITALQASLAEQMRAIQKAAADQANAAIAAAQASAAAAQRASEAAATSSAATAAASAAAQAAQAAATAQAAAQAPAGGASAGGGSGLLADAAEGRLGRDYDFYKFEFDGSHADGLGFVPFDNYRARLHYGEGVIDAPAMAALRRYFGAASLPGADGSAATLQQLLAAVEKQNGLLEELVAEVEAGTASASTDLRSFKQHLSAVIAQAVHA